MTITLPAFLAIFTVGFLFALGATAATVLVCKIARFAPVNLSVTINQREGDDA